MKKIFMILLSILLTLGFIIGGCGGEEAVEEEEVDTGPYGTITVAVADFANESTDPINLESIWGWAFYDALLRWDKNGKLIPGVADEWTLEGNTWTFKIHPGIKFHNGDSLTAHDVKFSMDRFSDMEQSSNPWSFFLSKSYNQVETRVIDDYTFQFVQDHPEPAQIIIMAWVRILPKEYYESVGMEEFRRHPVGSGPWKFVELVSETSMTLEANTEYWRPEEIPAYKYYKELQVPELATRISMLKTGEVDLLYFLSDWDQIDGLIENGFTSFKMGVPGTSSLAIQGSWLPDAGPVGDIRVRKAMSYALNRQEICDTLFAGYATPGGQFYMYPGGYGWSDALKPDPYDPTIATQLLEEAGYPNAFDDPVITVYTTAAGGLSGGPDLFLLLMSYWEAVGLQVEMEVLDATIWNNYMFNFTRLQGGEENVGWIFCWNYDAFFNSTYQAANMYCSWGTHNAGNDPTSDELYLKAAGETDPVLGAQYFAEFQEYAKTMYVNIGIAQTEGYVVYNPETIGEWTGRNWVSYWDAFNGIQHPKK